MKKIILIGFSIIVCVSKVFAQATYVFTNAGAEGSYGPTQIQINSAYAETSLDGLVTINTQGIQEFVVPVSGSYRIQAIGATGGNQEETHVAVGQPANIAGDFELIQGQVLKILVGQHGFLGSRRPGWGGGGGTFVVIGDDTPLVVAGGSGSGHTDLHDYFPEQDANIVEVGKNSSGGTGAWLNGYGATGGNGGDGAGFYGNGTVGNNSTFDPVDGQTVHTIPQAFINGGAGDEFGGGFGGGGGVTNTFGGGAGGYSGGQGAVDYPYNGGGGGSFNNGSNQNNVLNDNDRFTMSHGRVTIQLLCTPTKITADIKSLPEIIKECSVESLPVPTATNDCGQVVNGTTDTSLPIIKKGTYEVIWNFDDGQGNTLRQTQSVKVIDETQPTINTQNITVQLDNTGAATITAADINNGSTDACGIATYVLDITSFTCENVGDNTVTLTVTDNNGNAGTGTATVTVEDKAAPVVSAKAVHTIQLDASGAAILAVADILTAASTDVCGIKSEVLSKTSFNCSDVANSPLQVTLTVSDNNGNVTNKTIAVTVEDKVPPAVFAKTAHSIQLDASGEATLSVADILTGASADACGIKSEVLSKTSFGCSDMGANPVDVTLTVTDKHDNVTTKTIAVSVEDETAPVVSAKAAHTIQLDASGAAALVVSDILTAASSDACGIKSEVLSKTSFSCSDIAANPVQVALTVTDNNDNVTTKTVAVTVEDKTAPVITANAAYTISLNAEGVGTFTEADMLTVEISDACGIKSEVLSKTTFGCSDVANSPVQVTLTVTDNNGNVANKTVAVTVEDKVAPVVSAKETHTIQLDASGAAILAVADVLTAASADACGIKSEVLSKTSFGCSDIAASPVQVTITVTDNNDNVTTKTIAVTVEDKTAPVVPARTTHTIQLDASGAAALVVSDIQTAESSDACGINSQVLSRNSFDCSDLAASPVQVTITVTDNNDNVTTKTLAVTVEDKTAPVVPARTTHTIQLDASGAAALVVSDILTAESSDACGIKSQVLSRNSFDCSDIAASPVQVTITVTDNNDNVTTKTVAVTVEDKIAPSLTVQDVRLVLNDEGSATLTEALAVVSKADNCAAPVISFSQSVFSCENTVEPVAITVTATDASGNTTDKVVNVRVVDETAPVAIAKNITLELDANGEAVLTAAALDGGSYDNCSITEMSISATSFSCADAGEQTVTLTVTDHAGLSATATAAVTVVDVIAPVVENCPADLTIGLKTGATYVVPDFTGQVTVSDNCTATGRVLQLPVAGTELSSLGTHVVQLKTVDASGNEGVCSFIITLEHRNTAPAGLSLSASSVEENQAEGVLIGYFGTEDVDGRDTHSYALVSGDGSDDNANFYIEGNALYSALAFDYELKKSHTIRVVTLDAEGERFEKIFTIQVTDVEDARVFIPNLFSPNNDGSNDTFRVRANGIQQISFRIFNRMGVLVYETSNVQQATETGWDGTYKGKEQPAGSYVWQISGKFSDGAVVQFDGKSTGNITLIR